MTDFLPYPTRSRGLSAWWGAKKNAFYSSLKIQDLASRIPLLARISRKEGEAIFQLMSGFVDTQILLTFVRSGALEHLYHGPLLLEDLAAKVGLDFESTTLLCRAGQALGLVRMAQNKVFLARRGALVRSLPGISELIDHHAILYRDLTDPLAFLRAESERELANFWPYVFGKSGDLSEAEVARYSSLMTKSQFMVARDTLSVLKVPKNVKWLDVGGGSGAFVAEVLRQHTTTKAAVFDLNGTQDKTARHTFIEGSFFDDEIPKGFDVISLVRVLYDHSDDTVKKLLIKVYTSLPKGGRLIVSEPMLGDPVPNRFGDTYFAFYTLAMNTGKTRSPSQISDLLSQIGFKNVKIHSSKRPFVTTVIEACKN